MSTMRVPPAEITGLFGALVKRFSVKKLGKVPKSLGVMWHSPAVLKALFGLSGKAQKWRECDPQLKSFAHMATASLVGCSFCLDLGYFQALNDKLDLNKAREVPRWRDSHLFTTLERDALEYAEAMTHTPPTVTDDLSRRLLKALGAPALLELTAFIGAANLTARMNTALGIESEGFSAACDLKPLTVPSHRGVPSLS